MADPLCQPKSPPAKAILRLPGRRRNHFPIRQGRHTAVTALTVQRAAGLLSVWKCILATIPCRWPEIISV
jgi:hypothetical protein